VVNPPILRLIPVAHGVPGVPRSGCSVAGGERSFREQLRDLLIFAVCAIGLVAGVFYLGRIGAVFCAFVLGGMTIFAVFGWMVGGDVFSLPWLWGSLGEQATAEELDKLGSVWFVAHDIENSHGNWDHIVVGPGGVFLIDSKNLQRSSVTPAGDGLSSGRLRISGGTFRGGAVALRETIAAQTGSRPWVQAVVAVWGKFPEKRYEYDRVTYLRADLLATWLQQQPRRLNEEQQESLMRAIRQIADSSTAARTA
jgi:hypothetical protein